MNAEVKRAWITALRSGSYKQGQGSLHTAEKGEPELFCCLGVLCDLAVKAGACPPPTLHDGRHVMAYGRTREPGTLPVEVREWAELDSSDGSYYSGRQDDSSEDEHPDSSLAADNDDGVEFPDIAKTIEKHF